MSPRIPENIFMLSHVGAALPPRDPEDDDDEEDDNDADEDREPPVIREPDEDE